ncbi:MAG: hypothetical protein IPF67_05380 [Saprospiraceae bacterium]|nr:hypothetical protein [Candidatus Brachybacter algidus]
MKGYIVSEKGMSLNDAYYIKIRKKEYNDAKYNHIFNVELLDIFLISNLSKKFFLSFSQTTNSKHHLFRENFHLLIGKKDAAKKAA